MRSWSRRATVAAICALLAFPGVAGCKRDPGTAAAPAIVRVAEVVPSSLSRSAPINLATADGAGLELVGLHAQSVVQAPLAFTELRLTFRNPEERVREGRFEIQLPPGAVVSRFAMKIGDKWQEGAVVEKKLATRAYEDFLHRRQDPALLEQAAGNSFSARVFPIPARATKEIIVSYSQEVGQGHGVLIPLAGLPAIQDASVQVSNGSGASAAQTITWSGRPPSGDIAIEGAGFGEADAVRSGGLIAARVRLPVAAEPEPWTATLLLVDTSASRGLGLEAQVALVGSLVGRIASQSADLPVAVACFDETVDQVYVGRAGGFGAAELEKIRARGALGASDLERALRWGAEAAKQNHLSRVVLLTDGVATAGHTEGKELGEAAAAFQQAGVQRLDAIVVGGIRDEAGLRRLVAGGLPHAGTVVAGAQGLTAAAARLEQRTHGAVKIEVQNASWSWPTEVSGAQAGDAVALFAELPEGEPVVIKLADKKIRVDRPAKAEPRLLTRGWAKARIDGLLDKEAREGKSDQLQQEITSLSVKNRVLSPYTALLVCVRITVDCACATSKGSGAIPTCAVHSTCDSESTRPGGPQA